REVRARALQRLDGAILEALEHARAKRRRVRVCHMAQPVRTLREHHTQELLDALPSIVEALKKELDIGGQLWILLAFNQSRPCGAGVQLQRVVLDIQRPA